MISRVSKAFFIPTDPLSPFFLCNNKLWEIPEHPCCGSCRLQQGGALETGLVAVLGLWLVI